MLINDNVIFLKDYIPKLIEAIEKEVEYLTDYTENEAFSLLPNIIDGLVWSLTSIHGLEKLGYISDLKKENLNAFLKEIEETMKKKDYISMTDIFQFEIIEILEEWLEKVNTIQLEYENC